MSEERKNEGEKAGFLTLPMLRDIAAVALIAVFTWKLMGSELRIDLSAFSFTDLLSLCLALFSVALSVAFYFKASDTSNKFYNDTYAFTKQMSEILGRIEAGFGERLRHLDEGYTGVKDRLDRIPLHYPATATDVKEEQEEIRKKEEEQKAMIEELAKKAHLAEHERKELFDTLEKRQEELDQARAELRMMIASRDSASEKADMPSSRYVLQYLSRKILESFGSDRRGERFSIRQIREEFAKIRGDLPRGAIRDLERHELLNADGDLSVEALAYVAHEVRRI